MSISDGEAQELEHIRREVRQPHDRLLQAKGLLLCGLPYFSTEAARIEREAKLGPDATLRVVYTAANEMPYGADRALLAWIQTRAHPDGFVAFDRLLDFFEAFGLGASGRSYERFHERLRRIRGLGLYVELTGEGEEASRATHPVEASFTLRDRVGKALPEHLLEQLPSELPAGGRYGFKLSNAFTEYFCAEAVPMPLPLMRHFHGRPQAWDFAQFVLWRQFAARQATIVPWEGLVLQMGFSDSNPWRLKKRLGEVLAKMRVVYPDMPARFTSKGHSQNGLLVAPWKPPRSQPAPEDL